MGKGCKGVDKIVEETRQRINRILTEIEQDNIVDNRNMIDSGKKTAADVVKILLGEEQQKNGANASNASGYAFDMEALNYWREKNNQIYEIHYYHPVCSYKKVIGSVIVAVKKFFRKLLKSIFLPIIMEQNNFNASVTASINSLYNNEIITAEFIRTQEEKNEKIRQLQNEVEKLKRKCSKTNETIRDKIKKDETEIYDQLEYGKFEDYFRGAKEDIKRKQEMYLPYFTECNHVIDLGCGRGEFLELLSENKVQATGVDFNKEFIEDCVQRGLAAVEGDAVAYLHEMEDGSVDGIFAAQLVEHLKTNELIQLCKEAYCKLRKGGYLVIETPNPTCLSIYSNAFYMDPSHNKPVHPKTLEYFLREAGFEQVEIIFTECSKVGYRLPLLEIEGVENLQKFNDGLNCLSDLIFGSQDYAIIAQKK